MRRAVFVVAVVATSAALVHLAARGWLLLDDFNTVGTRLARVREVGWWSALNAAHNDHWSAAFLGLHLTLVKVFGLDTYLPMAMLAVGSVAIVVVLVRAAMHRAGEVGWLAVVWPVTLFWWGTAPFAVLWGFDAVFTLAEAAIIGVALLLRDTDAPSRWAVAGLLLVGAALQGAVLIGALVVILSWVVAAVDVPARRRRAFSGMVMVGPAGVATALWRWLAEGPAVAWTRLPGEPDPYNVPPRLGDGLGYAASLGRRVLTGFVPWSGSGRVTWVVAVAVGAVFVRTIAVRYRDRGSRSVLVGLPVAAVVLVLTIGVVRVGAGQGPAVSRYLHLASALLFPVAGLAVGDLGRAAARLVGQRGHVGRTMAASVAVGVVVVALVVVGADRTRDSAHVLRVYASVSRVSLKGLLADPQLGLIPRDTRVGTATLDLNVGHVVDLGTEGLLRPAALSARDRVGVVSTLHIRPFDPRSDPPALALSRSGAAVGRPTCQSSVSDGRTVRAVDLAPNATGRVQWSVPPRSLAVRVTLDGVKGEWRRIRPVSSLDLDGVPGMVAELRMVGPWSTC